MTRIKRQELHPVLTGARLSKEIAHIPRRRRERAFVKIADELWLPIDTEQSLETLSVAYSRLYPTGVLTGWSAAALHGVDAPREAVPELCVGPHGRVRAGLRLRRYAMPGRAVMSVRGVPVTTPTWTAFDLARFNNHVDGVLALESLYRKGFTPALMQQTIDSLAGTWGVARARRVLADSDVRSESPRETETRLFLHAAGYTDFVPQVEVKDLGYRLDLADPVRRIAVEYDGLHHDDPTQQSKDRTRRNRLQAAGWIVIVVDRRIFRHQREDILRQVEAAYRLTALRGAA